MNTYVWVAGALFAGSVIVVSVPPPETAVAPLAGPPAPSQSALAAKTGTASTSPTAVRSDTPLATVAEVPVVVPIDMPVAVSLDEPSVPPSVVLPGAPPAAPSVAPSVTPSAAVPIVLTATLPGTPSAVPVAAPPPAAALPSAAMPIRPEAERFDCLISPNALIALGAEVQGVVEHIAVERGERVTKGQTLVTMKADVENADVAQARDRVAMDSEIAAREADLEFARQVLVRQKSLLAQKLAPQQSVDEVRARYLVAEASLRRARDNAVLDRHALLRHEALLAQRTLVSPIDGTVTRRHAEPGELVVDAPVLTIVELDTLRIDVVLPSERFGQFAPGDVATVYPEIAPARPARAIVSTVDPMLDAASGTFAVQLTLDNADRSVVAGQECLVAFHDDPGSARP